MLIQCLNISYHINYTGIKKNFDTETGTYPMCPCLSAKTLNQKSYTAGVTSEGGVHSSLKFTGRKVECKQ